MDTPRENTNDAGQPGAEPLGLNRDTLSDLDVTPGAEGTDVKGGLSVIYVPTDGCPPTIGTDPFPPIKRTRL